MKKMRLMVWFTALVSLIGFSSCLGDDDGERETVMLLKTVDPYMGMGSLQFQDVTGTKFVPNKSISAAKSEKFAYVQFRYNQKELAQLNQTNNSLPIELLADPVFISEAYSMPEAPEPEMDHNTLVALINNGVWKDKMDNCLILTLQHYVKAGTNNDNISTEAANHDYTLYLDGGEHLDDQDLNLELRYRRVEATPEDKDLNKTFSVAYGTPKYFDISSFVNDYEAKHGKSPRNVNVRFYKSSGVSFVKDNTYNEVATTLYPARENIQQ